MSRLPVSRVTFAARWASLALVVTLAAIAAVTGLELVSHTYDTNESAVWNLSNLSVVAALFGVSFIGALTLGIRVRDDYLRVVGRPAM